MGLVPIWSGAVLDRPGSPYLPVGALSPSYDSTPPRITSYIDRIGTYLIYIHNQSLLIFRLSNSSLPRRMNEKKKASQNRNNASGSLSRWTGSSLYEMVKGRL